MKKIYKAIAILLSFILVAGLGFNTFAENANSWKNKIDPKIYEHTESKDDKIPVYIWITDVDHTEVIEETEKALGYGEEDLTVIDENMSDELVAEIAALSENPDNKTVSEEIRSYMDKTKKHREKEKEKTDKYIGEKRKNYKEKYNKNSKDFLEKAKISDEDIVYTSQYAPMIIAELTKKQIEKLAKSDDVDAIYFYESVVGVDSGISMSEICESTNVSYIHETLSLSGQNVKIGMVEKFNVITNDELPPERFSTVGATSYDETSDDDLIHSNNTAQILAGENGVAHQATVYSSSIDAQIYYSIAVEELLSNGVTLINSSSGYPYDYYYSYQLTLDEFMESYNYTNVDKWVDHIALYHNVSFIVSAGNYGHDIDKDGVSIKHRISAPGLAYNVITVGAYDNKNTLDFSDDTMYYYSSYNDFGGCAKPDLVAPANMLGGGTSSSAPFVSGIIALMLELRPSLAAYPQIIKAILSASCHHKALPAANTDATETMSQGLTDKQGTGVVDPYRAISITGSGNYGIRTLSETNTSSEIRLTQPAYSASGLNVSIAWLRSNTVTSSDLSSASSVTEAPAHNIDLSLLSGNTVLKSSANTNSSTEMVYYDNPTATSAYTVKIDKTDSASVTVKIGYAWSLDNERFQYKDEHEGIFYLKNVNSGHYLTLNSSDNSISQSGYIGSIKQMWILQKTASGDYRINSAYKNTGCLNVGTLISGRYYNNVLDTSNPYEIKFLTNSDGTLSIYKYISGTYYYLTLQNNDTSIGSSVVWLKYSSASDFSSSMKWYVEPYSYQKGDVNMDGNITAADADNAMDYSSGTLTLTNAKIYLADINNDQAVTASDARTILRMAAGLE